jgi:hypothetical protein
LFKNDSKDVFGHAFETKIDIFLPSAHLLIISAELAQHIVSAEIRTPLELR